jgi:hypothetical protein
MTVIEGNAPRGLWLTVPKLPPLVWCAGIFACALLWQYFLFGVNTDTSWIITVCERMLTGDRLYVDILEVNPPMTMWMYMPAVVFARAVGIAPEVAVHGYTYLACFGGLGLAAYIARAAEFEDNPRLYAMLPAFLALLIVLPAYTFSQREHFGVALLLPLLTLMAWRVKADSHGQPGFWLAVAAGLCGSVLVLVKPYYAVMIVVPAIYVAWKKRSVFSLFTVEYWVIACVCGGYLAAVLMIYPEYVRYIVPLVIVVMISAAAGLAPLTYQGKGFPYHALPALMLGLGALACKLYPPGNSFGRSDISGKLIVLTFLLGAYPFFLTARTDAAMVETVRDRVTRPTVGMIGTSIEIGHPFTRMVDGVWTGQHCND